MMFYYISLFGSTNSVCTRC